MVRRLLVNGLIVFVAFTVGISAYLLTSSKWADFWKKDPATQVYFNGMTSPASVTYRGDDGLSLLNTSEDGAWYIYAADGYLAYCDSLETRSHRFFTVKLAGYFYVWHYSDYPCVGPVKVDVERKVVGTNMIEFNSRRNDRIRVIW